MSRLEATVVAVEDEAFSLFQHLIGHPTGTLLQGHRLFLFDHLP